MAGHWSLASFKPEGRGPVPRPESFGRYDPINHSFEHGFHAAEGHWRVNPEAGVRSAMMMA